MSNKFADDSSNAKAPHRCPWWMGYLLLTPLRALSQNPRRILGPLVKPGMIVLEPGPGMGFFTLELARLVGPSGRVIAVDVEPRMLTSLGKRLAKAGLADRVDLRLTQGESLAAHDLDGQVDFVLAFAVIHELPDHAAFFAQAASALKPGGGMLVAEPSGHVSAAAFGAEMEVARSAGFEVGPCPTLPRGRAALLRR